MSSHSPPKTTRSNMPWRCSAARMRGPSPFVFMSRASSIPCFRATSRASSKLGMRMFVKRHPIQAPASSSPSSSDAVCSTVPVPLVSRSRIPSWLRTSCPSRVRRMSSSTRLQPMRPARARDSRVFSGMSLLAVRWQNICTLPRCSTPAWLEQIDDARTKKSRNHSFIEADAPNCKYARAQQTRGEGNTHSPPRLSADQNTYFAANWIMRGFVAVACNPPPNEELAVGFGSVGSP